MSKGLVLVFHKEDDGKLFEQIIIALKARYSLVSLEQLETLLIEKRSTRNICHISFDDGELSFYNTVFPLLKTHNVPASLFISPDVIVSRKNYWFQEITGYDENIFKEILSHQLNMPATSLKRFNVQSVLKCLPFRDISAVIDSYKQKTNTKSKPPMNMDEDQLRIVDESGLVTVGAHTLNHPILANETDDDCFHEITDSIKKLQTLLGHPIKYFAYPNGRPEIDFGEREKTYLRENEIALAFSAELDNLSASIDPLSVPRMGFARMGLSPSNPFITYRLNVGKGWLNIRSIWQTSEKKMRARIRSLIKKANTNPAS